MSTVAPLQTEMTVEELAARVGAIPLWRIRTDPPPGFATAADVERLRRDQSVLCELLDGVLVEKAVSDKTAFLAAEMITFPHLFVRPRRLVWVLGPDWFVRLFGTHLRAPDWVLRQKGKRMGRRGMEGNAKTWAARGEALGIGTPRPSRRSGPTWVLRGKEGNMKHSNFTRDDASPKEGQRTIGRCCADEVLCPRSPHRSPHRSPRPVRPAPPNAPSRFHVPPASMTP